MAIVLSSILGTLALGAGLAYLGVRFAGSIEGFQRFMQRAALGFLVWRLGLYSVGLYLYLRRYRPALLARAQQEQDPTRQREARNSLRQLEWLMLGAIALVEAYNLGAWT